MTPEQYWLLRHLEEAGPTSIGELAAQLGITPSSATIACKRLERGGFVLRERQASDERVVKVQLTPRGMAQLQAWRDRLFDALALLLEPLDAGEQDELAALLERVLAQAEAPERAEPAGSAGGGERKGGAGV
ncbi:MAG: MarR family transcriptional regulator [Bacillota bacterium]|nr:MarR family transcriptional regulator [Bacillota bacterium]